MMFDKEGAKGNGKHMTHSRTMWQGADGEDSAAFPTTKVSSATSFTWSCDLINTHYKTTCSLEVSSAAVFKLTVLKMWQKAKKQNKT